MKDMESMHFKSSSLRCEYLSRTILSSYHLYLVGVFNCPKLKNSYNPHSVLPLYRGGQG
jgi:hypothetical protein